MSRVAGAVLIFISGAVTLLPGITLGFDVNALLNETFSGAPLECDPSEPGPVPTPTPTVTPEEFNCELENVAPELWDPKLAESIAEASVKESLPENTGPKEKKVYKENFMRLLGGDRDKNTQSLSVILDNDNAMMGLIRTGAADDGPTHKMEIRFENPKPDGITTAIGFDTGLYTENLGDPARIAAAHVCAQKIVPNDSFPDVRDRSQVDEWNKRYMAAFEKCFKEAKKYEDKGQGQQLFREISKFWVSSDNILAGQPIYHRVSGEAGLINDKRSLPGLALTQQTLFHKLIRDVKYDSHSSGKIQGFLTLGGAVGAFRPLGIFKGRCRCNFQGEVGMDVSTFEAANRGYVLVGITGDAIQDKNEPGARPLLSWHAQHLQNYSPESGKSDGATSLGARIKASDRVSVEAQARKSSGPANLGLYKFLDTSKQVPVYRLGVVLYTRKKPR